MTGRRPAAIVRAVHGRLNDNPPEGGRSVGDVLASSRDTAARRPAAGPDGLPLSRCARRLVSPFTFQGANQRPNGLFLREGADPPAPGGPGMQPELVLVHTSI